MGLFDMFSIPGACVPESNFNSMVSAIVKKAKEKLAGEEDKTKKKKEEK